jgi:hypothetical protein
MMTRWRCDECGGDTFHRESAVHSPEVSLKDEVRGTLSGAIGALVAAGAKSFVEWVATRPVKRAIERRRARKADKAFLDATAQSQAELRALRLAEEEADPPADPPCRKE